MKKYQKIREALKQQNIDGKTVKQIESELVDNERKH
jgi:hypothetical protein